MKKVVVYLAVLGLAYVLVGCGKAQKSPEIKVSETPAAEKPQVYCPCMGGGTAEEEVSKTPATAPVAPVAKAKPAVTPATMPIASTAKTPNVPDATPAVTTTPKAAPENK
ncbi:MAG: hypothetical protein PHR77_22490 [Kiritimatiellae bacterium]|nr:hypothetical protein [Kiritimatiellia bacterium]MDD5520623.1 hypothetical protein [Kiritimatiellia bacterium]